MGDESLSELEKAASDRPRDNIVSDFWYFLRRTGKYWLLPILVMCLLLGALMLLLHTAAAPFIYAIF
jgi:hypothetical protein